VGAASSKQSICPGWGGTQMLPARIDPERAIRMTAVGKPMKYDEAVAEGLFDATCADPGELRRVSASWVADRAEGAGVKLDRDGAPSVWIGRGEGAAAVADASKKVRGDHRETEAALAVLDCVDRGLDGGWNAGIGAEREHLVRLRHTPEAKAAIESFFSKAK